MAADCGGRKASQANIIRGRGTEDGLLPTPDCPVYETPVSVAGCRSQVAGRRSQVAGRTRSRRRSRGGRPAAGSATTHHTGRGGGRNTMERAPPNPDRHALSRAHVGRRLQGTGRWVRAQARARGFGHGSVSHHSVGLSPWSHAGDARARRRGGRRGGGGAERHERCLPSPPCRQVLSISIVSISEQATYEQCTRM